MSDGTPQQNDPRDAVFDTAHLKANIGSRAGRGSVVVLLFAALKLVVQLGTTAILARLVAPADHGIIAMAMPAILIATSLSEFGLAEAVIQRDKVTHRMASALFWTNTGIGIALAIVVVGLAYPATLFYEEPRIGAVFLALAPTIIFAAMGAQFVAILRRQMRVRQIETILLISTVASVATAVLMALAGFSYWAIAAQILSQPVFSLFMMAAYTGWRPSRPSANAMKEARNFLKFGGLLAASRLLSQITQSFGMIIVGRAFSATEAGLYYRSWTLANLPQQRAVGPLASVFLPAFSRTNDDARAFQEVFKRAATRIALITVPIGIGLCSAADLVVDIVLGSQWTETAPLLAWFGVITLQSSAMYTLQWSLVAMGKASSIFYYRLFAAVVTVVSLLIGLQYGITGMVAAYMIAILLVQLPVLCAVVIKQTPINFAALIETFLIDALVAAGAIAFIFYVRSLLPETNLFAELGIVCALVILVMIARVLPNKALRNDAGKAIGVLVKRRNP